MPDDARPVIESDERTYAEIDPADLHVKTIAIHGAPGAHTGEGLHGGPAEASDPNHPTEIAVVIHKM